MATTMEFVTLTTGSTTMARRADIVPDTMLVSASLLAGGTAGGWSTTLDAGQGFVVAHEGRDVVRCLLCADRARSDILWEAAEALAPPAVVLHRPRGTPWLAVALLPGAFLLPRELLLALPWLELGIAWCLLEFATP